MKNGGGAFPCNTYGSAERGMNLRDYFAGQVLAQIISRDTDPKKYIRDNAATAYLYADAMLAERERNDETQ